MTCPAGQCAGLFEVGLIDITHSGDGDAWQFYGCAEVVRTHHADAYESC